MSTKLARPASGMFKFGRAVCAGLSHLWRLQAYGVEHVPLDGPLIIAANHMSYLDPPMLGVALPRQISYMAKKELFDIPILGALISGVGTYPVDRNGSAKAAIKRSLEVLATGGAIGIFPEGTRNTDGSHKPQQGVALLASLSGAAVLPAALYGSDQASKLHQIKVAFGEPLRLPSDRKATREDLANFTGEVMSAIRALKMRLEDGNS